MSKSNSERLLHSLVAMGVALTAEGSLALSVAACGDSSHVDTTYPSIGIGSLNDAASADGSLDGTYPGIGIATGDGGLGPDARPATDTDGGADASASDADAGCYPCIGSFGDGG